MSAAAPVVASKRARTEIERIRFGLRFKIILGLTLFNLLGTAVFSWNHYRVEKHAIIDGIERKLAAAARALPDMLPEGYLDRAASKDGISEEEYERVLRKLSAYCQDTDLIYLYTYHFVDGKFRTTSSNGTPEELATDSYAEYWEEYDEPLLTQAWHSNLPQYGQTSEEDEWGRVYFLFSPRQTAAGTRYIVGADIAIARLYARLEKSLHESILIGSLSFIIVFAVSFVIGTRVSRKIARLAEYTRELAATDFQPIGDNALRREVVQIPRQSRDEIAQLAGSFIAMEGQLNDYLSELTETTATKERLRNELKIAGDIQLSMLPRAFAQVLEGRQSVPLDLHAVVKPAKEAGGDLYDFFFIDENHLCFLIGDVSDKGMPAALFMTVTTTLLRAHARAHSELVRSPDRILAETNDVLAEQNPMCQFVTLFLGVLDIRNGELRYACGGHNPPYLCRPGAPPRALSMPEGVALGVMPGMDFAPATLQLQAGDTLYLYTDGVTEAVAVDDSFYGEARLEAVLSELGKRADTSAQDWTERTLQEVEGFAEGHSQADDITILSLRYQGTD